MQDPAVTLSCQVSSACCTLDKHPQLSAETLQFSAVAGQRTGNNRPRPCCGHLACKQSLGFACTLLWNVPGGCAAEGTARGASWEPGGPGRPGHCCCRTVTSMHPARCSAKWVPPCLMLPEIERRDWGLPGLAVRATFSATLRARQCQEAGRVLNTRPPRSAAAMSRGGCHPRKHFPSVEGRRSRWRRAQPAWRKHCIL